MSEMEECPGAESELGPAKGPKSPAFVMDIDTMPLLDPLEGKSTEVEAGLPVRRSPSKALRIEGAFGICAILVGAVVVCGLGAYMGAPALASMVVNNANFNVEQLRVYKLPDEEEFEFGESGLRLPVHMKADVGVSSSFSAKVQGVTLEVFWSGQNLGSFYIDNHSIDSGKGSIDHDSIIVVNDKALLQDLAASVLEDGEVKYTIKGEANSVQSKIIGIPVPFSLKGITFEKEITLQGFSHMDNLIEIGTFDLGSKSTATVAVVETDITVSNPTTLVIDDVGDLEMEVRSVPQPGDGSPEDGWLVGMMKVEKVYVPNTGSKAVFHTTATFQVENLKFSQQFAHDFVTDHPVAIHTKTTGGTNKIWADIFKKMSISMVLTGPNVMSYLQNPIVREVQVNPQGGEYEGSPYYLTSAKLSFDVKCPVPAAEMTFNSLKGDFTLLYDGKAISTGNVDNKIASSRHDDIYTVTTEVNDLPARFVEDGMEDNFALFAKDFVQKDELTVTIRVNVQFDIDTSLEVKKLLPLKDTYSVDFKLQGLNGLKGAEVLDLDLPGDSPEGGVQSISTVKMVNPSVGSLRLGKASFVLNVDGVDLGRMTVPDQLIVPGENTVKLSGYVLPKEEDREAAGRVFSRIISSHKVDVKAYQGESFELADVQWLKEVLAGLEILTAFQPPEYGQLIRNPVVHSGEVVFFENKDSDDMPWGQMMSGKISAEFVNPYGFNLAITKTNMKTTTYDENDKEFSHLSANNIHVDMNKADGKSMIEFEISKVPLVIDSLDGMQKVWSNAINQLEEILPLKCDTDPYVSSAMGDMLFSDIMVKTTIALEGVGGFKDPPIEITKVDLIDGNKDVLRMSIDLTITPQDKVALAFDMQSTLKLCMEYNGVMLGDSGIEMFKVEPHKVNNYKAVSTYTAGPESAPGREFLSNYLNMVDTTVKLKGCEDGSSTAIPMLRQALLDFNTPVTIKAVEKQLMKDCQFQFTDLIKVFSDRKLPARVTFYNPFSTKIEIVACNLSVRGGGGHTIGNFVQTEADEPIVMEPLSEQTTNAMPVNINLGSMEAWIIGVEAVLNDAHVEISGTLTTRIGEYVMDVDYTQKGVYVHH